MIRLACGSLKLGFENSEFSILQLIIPQHAFAKLIEWLDAKRFKIMNTIQSEMGR